MTLAMAELAAVEMIGVREAETRLIARLGTVSLAKLARALDAHCGASRPAASSQ
jgi:hypothetical protein